MTDFKNQLETRKNEKFFGYETVFCGTHDMPLRGKQADEGVLLDLLKLRIDSGDNKLKSHFEKCRRNAIYTSPRIQNELINLCGEVIQENVISEVRKTMAYSILADETADVSGKEQLSIGVRFYDESKSKIREEFVGFVELKAQNASAIAEAIDNFLISSNLSKEDCVGFGFDGCSTMAGKEGGVQAILRKKYPRALYFHCSSHKLNLVVNDANAVPEIRNTVATVKDVITFFRESTTRRNYAPNLSRLCETRWSEKYKSIRKFSQHFSELVKSLETLSVEGNYATRKSAYQLHSAVTKPVFIVSLQTIAKYSAVIEPVVNALQAKSIDMISVGKHIKNIKDILRNDREFPDRISNEILQKARAVAMDLNIEISVPRLAHKQTHRSNPPSDNDNEYWRRSLIIPYIDSLISSLNIRFSQENTPAFALSRLHPLYMTKTSIADLHKNAESFQEFYNLDITGELNLWHNLWVTKALSDDQLKDIEVVDLFKEANIFYPAVRKALIILSTIPCTTATVERSFSTLRRVKTWLRSTMGEERLTVIEVCLAIWKTLKEKRMKFPTEEDFKSIAKGFGNKGKFPHCIGCIDGKQILCDSDCRFRIVDVVAYGKDSDGGVLSSSKLYQEIKNGRCKFPAEEPLPDSNIVAPYVFLGDDSFSLTNFLLRPYPQRQLPGHESRNIFNQHLSSTRMTIERSFGIDAGKFRILLKSIETNVDNAITIGKTICLLHNILIDRDGSASHRPELQMGSLQNSRANNSPAGAATNIREPFTTYFANRNAFLATGLAFRQLAFTFRISKSAVARIVIEVCLAIWKTLKEKHMKFPTEEDFKSIAKGFENKGKFPHCIGCIDGKHIRLKKPKNSGSMYFNYKHFFPIVLMAVCDSDCRFRIIDVGAYGKDSDGGVLSSSKFYQEIKNGRYEAFALTDFLLRPYPQRQLPGHESRNIFNQHLFSTRVTIERSFGIAAGRFRILLKSIETNIDNAITIVKTICLLHNILIDRDGSA
nr:unnamed protein product [Callosobruchus analis]